jgi:hypothetical protein
VWPRGSKTAPVVTVSTSTRGKLYDAEPTFGRAGHIASVFVLELRGGGGVLCSALDLTADFSIRAQPWN